MTGHHNNERGAALIVALVILVALTLVGVTSMQTTTLQERMSGNVRDRNVAFQAAESALRNAELRVSNFVNPDPAAIGWLFPDVDPNRYQEGTPEWNAAKAAGVTHGEFLDAANNSSNYIADAPWFFAEVVVSRDEPAGGGLEILPDGSPGGDTYTIFSITAVGSGGQLRNDGTPVSQVVLQSHFRRNGIFIPPPAGP